MFSFVKILFHKLYKSVVHDHEYVHDLPIEIYAGMLHRNQHKRTDLVNHGNVNALLNGSPVQNFHHIRHTHRDVHQHGIYYVLPNGVSMGTIARIPDK